MRCRTTSVLLAVVASAVVSLAASLPALADPPPDQATMEVARIDFNTGMAFFDKGDSEAAITEFLAARHGELAPKCDYMIARCYERMGRLDEAVMYYERVMSAQPDTKVADEVHRHLSAVRQRLYASEDKESKGKVAPPAVTASLSRRHAAETSEAPAATTTTSSGGGRRTPTWVWAVVGVTVGLVVAAGAGVGIYFATKGSSWPSFGKMDGN